MAEPPPPTYHHDIASVHTKHPGIPTVLANVDLNRNIRQGDAIDLAHLLDAQAVASTLKGIADSGHPTISQAVSRMADLRVKAIETAASTAVFAPVDLHGLLHALNDQLTHISDRLNDMENNMEARFDHIDEQLAIVKASTTNIRIIAQNQARQGLQQGYKPLQKMVPGHGFDMATQLIPAGSRFTLVAPEQAADIGSTPNDFQDDPQRYNNRYILELIIFYNDDFGILVTDPLSIRTNKCRQFLANM